MDKNKLILPVSIIIGCIIIGGSFYVIQINKQESIEKQQLLKLELEREQWETAQVEREREKQEQLIKDIAEEEEEIRLKQELNECLEASSQSYIKRWIDECEERDQLPEACSGDRFVPVSDCMCKLPSTIASPLNKYLENAKEDCFRRYE